MSFYALRNIALAVLLAAFMATFWAIEPEAFGDPDNLRCLVTQNAELAVLAVGMTVVMLTAGIDLSVAGILTLAACVMGWAADRNWSGAATCGVGLAVGAACGLFNGLAVTLLSIPPIIATLATLFLFRGFSRVLTDDQALPVKNLYDVVPLFQALNRSEWSQIAVLGAILAAATAWLLTATYLRAACAVGGNEAVARYSGISVDRVKWAAYTLTGILCGAGAILYLSRSPSAKADVVQKLELSAIAAVLLGGTRVQGGEGSLVGTLLGVGLIAVLRNGLMILEKGEFLQMAVLGGIVIVSAAGNEPLMRWWARRGLKRP